MASAVFDPGVERARLDDLPLRVDGASLSAFCRGWRVRRLWLFGSVLTERFGPQSDVDAIVEFEPDALPGWHFVTFCEEFERLVGRSADVATPSGMRRIGPGLHPPPRLVYGDA